MTPKEKAAKIFNLMCNSVDELWPYDVKECALIAIDLAIEVESNIFKGEVYKSYWKEVKKELEKI